MDSEKSKTDKCQIERNQIKEEIISLSTRIKKVTRKLMCGGITGKEFTVLDILYTRGMSCRGRIYVSELADLLMVSAPQTSRLLKGMEEKGYIRREVDEKNRRNTFVYITDKGNQVREAAKNEMDEIAFCVTERMGEENVRKILELFNMSADILEDELKKRKDCEKSKMKGESK